MNTLRDNYSILLIKHSEMEDGELEQIVNKPWLKKILPFPEEDYDMSFDTPDKLLDVIHREEKEEFMLDKHALAQCIN